MRLMDLIKHILIGWQSNYLFPFSPLSTSERGLSLSNHLQIFINRRSAQITNPREFAHIHLLRYIGGIVLIENRGNIILICGSAAAPLLWRLPFRFLLLFGYIGNGVKSPA